MDNSEADADSPDKYNITDTVALFHEIGG